MPKISTVLSTPFHFFVWGHDRRCSTALRCDCPQVKACSWYAVVPHRPLTALRRSWPRPVRLTNAAAVRWRHNCGRTTLWSLSQTGKKWRVAIDSVTQDNSPEQTYQVHRHLPYPRKKTVTAVIKILETNKVRSSRTASDTLTGRHLCTLTYLFSRGAWSTSWVSFEIPRERVVYCPEKPTPVYMRRLVQPLASQKLV